MANDPFLAVDWGGTHIRLAWEGASEGEIHKERTPATLPAEGLREFLLACIRKLVDQGGRRLGGVALGVAGQIDSTRGVVGRSPNIPGLDGAPLAEWIHSAFQVPAYADNDVRAASYGEFLAGPGAGARALVCLFWGTGVGGGAVLGGVPLRGARNAAAEFGHMLYRPGGLACRCGKQGCYEAYAGGRALALRAGVPVEELFARAAGGDPAFRQLRDEALDAFGMLAANLAVAFNPDVFLIGGSVAAHRAEVKQTVAAALAAHSLEADRSGVRVEVGALGAGAALRGILALARL